MPRRRIEMKKLIACVALMLCTGCVTWFPGVSTQDLLEAERLNEGLNEPLPTTVPIVEYRF
jgi:hypothetical protein